jgi:hypothetical protein
MVVAVIVPTLDLQSFEEIFHAPIRLMFPRLYNGGVAVM